MEKSNHPQTMNDFSIAELAQGPSPPTHRTLASIASDALESAIDDGPPGTRDRAAIATLETCRT